MLEENRALIRRWFEEVWNLGRAEAIDAMLAEDAVGHGLKDPAGNPLTSRKDFKEFHRAFRNAFPDINVVVEDVIAEGDKVVALCTVRGRHTGDGLGMPASQRAFEITGTVFVRIRDGQIVEGWNNFDFLTLYQQIGAL